MSEFAVRSDSSADDDNSRDVISDEVVKDDAHSNKSFDNDVPYKDDPEWIISQIRNDLWPGSQYSKDASMALHFQYIGSSGQTSKFRLLVLASFGRNSDAELKILSEDILEKVEKYISTLLALLNDGSRIHVRLDLPDQYSYDIHQWRRINDFIKLFGELLDFFPLTLQSFDRKPMLSDYIDLRQFKSLEAERRSEVVRHKREEKIKNDLKDFVIWCGLMVLLWLFLIAIFQ